MWQKRTHTGQSIQSSGSERNSNHLFDTSNGTKFQIIVAYSMSDKFDIFLSAEVRSNFCFVVLTSGQMVIVGNGTVGSVAISLSDIMSTGLACH